MGKSRGVDGEYGGGSRGRASRDTREKIEFQNDRDGDTGDPDTTEASAPRWGHPRLGEINKHADLSGQGGCDVEYRPDWRHDDGVAGNVRQ